MKLCFATNNDHKLKEVQQLVGEQFELLTLNDIGYEGEIPEDYETMEENSLQKAQFIFDRYQINCFADDSGLEVDALNGAPGVYSARYAGPQRSHEDNNQKLLTELSEAAIRTGRFKAVISLIIGGEVRQFEGVVEGTIARSLQGEGGFGYDPLFIPSGYEITFAEMSDQKKNRLSHRGIAIARLVDYLKGLSND